MNNNKHITIYSQNTEINEFDDFNDFFDALLKSNKDIISSLSFLGANKKEGFLYHIFMYYDKNSFNYIYLKKEFDTNSQKYENIKTKFIRIRNIINIKKINLSSNNNKLFITVTDQDMIHFVDLSISGFSLENDKIISVNNFFNDIFKINNNNKNHLNKF